MGIKVTIIEPNEGRSLSGRFELEEVELSGCIAAEAAAWPGGRHEGKIAIRGEDFGNVDWGYTPRDAGPVLRFAGDLSDLADWFDYLRELVDRLARSEPIGIGVLSDGTVVVYDTEDEAGELYRFSDPEGKHAAARHSNVASYLHFDED